MAIQESNTNCKEKCRWYEKKRVIAHLLGAEKKRKSGIMFGQFQSVL